MFVCQTRMSCGLEGGASACSRIELLAETPFLVRFRLFWNCASPGPRFDMMEEERGRGLRYVSKVIVRIYAGGKGSPFNNEKSAQRVTTHT